jgi:hypothetical protein
MTRGTKILIFSLIGGGLFLVLICDGLIFLGFQGYKEIPKVLASSDRFMDQLNANQVEAAYKATTAEFQAAETLNFFKTLVARYPAFTKQATRSMSGVRINTTSRGIRATVQYNLTNPNNTLSMSLTLKNDNGTWKVEEINLPGAAEIPRN